MLVVTDPGITRFGLLDEVLPGFETEGLQVAVYDQVVADPPEHIVLAAVAQARASRVDLIIGFGGGSSMDVAKLVALLAHPECGQSLQDIYGVGNAKGQRLPLIQVPTTAGTGSEVTQIAIITTGETTKMGVVSPAAAGPGIARRRSHPRPAAGGDRGHRHRRHGACHRGLHQRAEEEPHVRPVGPRGAAPLGGQSGRAVHNGSNREARQAMLLGACLAGQAFANAPVAAVHALAYPLGGNFHIPHGLSNALVLPQVLRFNVSAAAALRRTGTDHSRRAPAHG